MRYRVILGCVILVLAATVAPAQTKTEAKGTTFTMEGTCGKPTVQQSAPAGDAADHVYTLAQGKCTPTKAAEMGGSKSKEASFSEHGEISGTSGHVWGTYTDTLASGDKVFYKYESKATMKPNNTMGDWSNMWWITGGTGKLKGIKGSGTCKGNGTADGGLTYSCTGTHMMIAAAPAKK